MKISSFWLSIMLSGYGTELERLWAECHRQYWGFLGTRRLVGYRKGERLQEGGKKKEELHSGQLLSWTSPAA